MVWLSRVSSLPPFRKTGDAGDASSRTTPATTSTSPTTPAPAAASSASAASGAERNALVILRALCRLSAQQGDAATDSLVLQGKLVALELLKSLLEHISDYR